MIALSADQLILALASTIVALLVGFILAYPLLSLLRALKSRQEISQFVPEGHQKKQGTPTMGGLLILSAMLAAAALSDVIARWLLPAAQANNYTFYEGDPADPNAPQMWAWFALVGAFALIGFVDDYIVPRLIKGKRGLGWIPKLTMQFGAAFFAVPALGGDFSWGFYALVALVVLFFANAYNFSDGLDGLAGSLGLILFGTAGTMALLLHLGAPTLWAFAAFGAFIPFLILNAPPAKVFMGDVGSLPIGALFGLFVMLLIGPTIDLWAAEYRYSEFSFAITGGVPGSDYFGRLDAWRSIPALVILSLVMIAEIVPVPLQIFWVKVFKRKLFPFTPIHHAFEKKGWPESRVVWTFALVQLALAIVSVAVLLPAISTEVSVTTQGAPRRLGP